MSNDDYLDPAVLENGKVLLALKRNYLLTQSIEKLPPLLACLRDSLVWVPMNTVMGDQDKRRMQSVKAGDIFSPLEDIHLKPDILKSPDGHFWFPIFSQMEQMPETYSSHFSKLKMSVLQAIGMAHATEGVVGIVLDAFTQSIALNFEIADLIPTMESHLKPDGQSGVAGPENTQKGEV